MLNALQVKYELTRNEIQNTIRLPYSLIFHRNCSHSSEQRFNM